MKPAWREKEIQRAIKNINSITDKARGKVSTCACSKEACEELEIYLETWVKAPLLRALKDTQPGRYEA